MSNTIDDSYGRPLRDLRISVTDRCNFRCPYCMPAEVYGERYKFIPRENLLTFEEIVRITSVLVDLGVEKVRITGGEPLIRQDVDKLIFMISEIEGINDLAMTTNAYLLKGFVKELRKAGLKRITVSLDSLDEKVFQEMNGRGFGTAKVLDGISAASEAGFRPIKINVVVKKGVNDHTLIDLARWCREEGHIPRFIEYMDVGTLNGWKLDEVVSTKNIVDRIGEVFPLEKDAPSYRGEAAKKYRYTDGKGEFGVISSVSQPFCGDCTRLRLTPEGMIVTCLFGEKGTDLRGPIREGGTNEDLRNMLIGIWNKRQDRYSELRTKMTKPSEKVEMYHIGG